MLQLLFRTVDAVRINGPTHITGRIETTHGASKYPPLTGHGHKSRLVTSKATENRTSSYPGIHISTLLFSLLACRRSRVARQPNQSHPALLWRLSCAPTPTRSIRVIVRCTAIRPDKCRSTCRARCPLVYFILLQITPSPKALP